MEPQQITQWLTTLEPEIHSAEECAEWVVSLARLGKACDAARARFAARAAAGAAHRRRGFVDPADWLADAAGTSSHQARRAIDTAQEVRDCPDTDEAWR